jgi:predicted Zn-dependent protease
VSPEGWHTPRATIVIAPLLLALSAMSASAASPADDGEARRARATASRIESTWPLAGSGPIATYVRKLGGRLGEDAGATPYPWRFVVVRNHAANAFAIGGGRIYVNDGVILGCSNEAEVAAILAHEMGHQQAGHFRAPGASTGRDEANPRIELGAVTQELDPAKEREADRVALQILAAAGYDPHAALTLALRQQKDPAPGAERIDQERIDGLRAALEAYPPGGKLDSDAYRALRDRLAAER